MKRVLRVSMALGVLLLLSCRSAEPPVLIHHEPILIEAADLRISLIYVDEASLESRHGHNNALHYRNPYYGYPGIFTKRKIYVFEFDAATTSSTVMFELKNIEMRKGAVEGSARSKEYLINIWRPYNGGDSKTMVKTLNETILDREFVVKPDDGVTGYLVFADKYPVDGNKMTLSFYLSTPDGDTGVLEHDIFIRDGRISAEKPKSTGIFAE